MMLFLLVVIGNALIMRQIKNESYEQGAKDAIMGKIKYTITTNQIVNIIKEK